ncbi:MAG: hypothetical protein AAF698_12425 [Pseudomonadota bacterium]
MTSTAQRREVVNRNTLVNRLLGDGYNAFLPVFDAGIDLIAHRETDQKLFLVQLKSRWTIGAKYVGRNIHIAFPDREDWFMAPHDEMVRIAEQIGYTQSASWRQRRFYHQHPMVVKLRAAMLPYRL